MKTPSLYPALIALLFPLILAAQSSGPRSPLGAYTQFAGCLSCQGSEWMNPMNVTQPDSVWAEIPLYSWPDSFQTSCYYSRFLFVTDFGFNIPAGAVITGVKAEILRKTEPAVGLITDSAIQLFRVSGPVGSIKATTDPFSDTAVYAVYGDSLDTWGYGLTSDSVNTSDFGLAIRLKNTATFSRPYVSAYIDHVRMTIWYDTGTGIESQTAEAAAVQLSYDEQSSVLTIFNRKQADLKRVTIWDINGRIVLSQSLNAGDEVICIPLNVSPGTYLWNTDGGFSGKLLIR